MIIDALNLSKSYGPVKALDNVSLTLNQGETLAIVGESGCGKTTLGKVLTGLVRPNSGTFTTKAQIQMVFQDPYTSLDPLYPIRDILDEAFYAQKNVSPSEKLQRMVQMLTAVGLEEGMLGRFPHEFSGGQRQRIAIARALLTNPSVLVLDEPTSALDVLVQKQIIDLLKAIKPKFNLTYIFISHNLRVVKNFSDRILVMRDGTVIESAATAQLFAQPRQEYTKQLLNAALNYVSE